VGKKGRGASADTKKYPNAKAVRPRKKSVSNQKGRRTGRKKKRKVRNKGRARERKRKNQSKKTAAKKKSRPWWKSLPSQLERRGPGKKKREGQENTKRANSRKRGAFAVPRPVDVSCHGRVHQSLIRGVRVTLTPGNSPTPSTGGERARGKRATKKG